MKTYKNFEKQYIGDSDVACLIASGCGDGGVKSEVIRFGGDNSYHAYIVRGKDVEIGSHYRLVASFRTWINIYDDQGLTFTLHEYDSTINVYRAGEYGCIIQVISKDEEAL